MTLVAYMITLAVTAEGADEPRCAISPETVKKLIQAGCTVRVQSGTGARSYFSDEALSGRGRYCHRQRP